jgi:hypothetical protein
LTDNLKPSITQTLTQLADIKFFSKIMAFIVLIGIFYLILENKVDEETMRNIVYMLVGGIVGLLFGQTKG